MAFLDYSGPQKPAPSQPKAALVFLHGLGNSPQTCIPLIQDRLSQLDPTLSQDIKFVFPSAPRLCSTINGGQCLPCWFDLYDWPVKVGVRDDKQGIRQAVQQIQDEVAKLEAEGIPKSRIVLGGFSQGATLALSTAYGDTTIEQPFAGCIALSGWLALRQELQCTPAACQTPLFWGHGQFDDSVKPEQQFFGVKKLLQQGVQSTTTKSYEMGHGVSAEELCDIAAFLKRVIYKQRPSTESIEKTESSDTQTQTALV
ncbi:protein thioesterase 1 [Seminavis robusta]|uniref:Protein thioesterase 1 n=1 Tax=Seminavis robusta TaxID=568900 RepID=A0A9N8DFY9_9STRA|nr:protein thioesterase 1 [Seminavis robusta]|eukprot:Sro132_g062630.1 protein thioesterase 1 (256) ;mRNA; r:63568-64335